MKYLTVDIGGTNIQFAVFNDDASLDYLEEYANDVSRGGRYMIEGLAERLSEYCDGVGAIGVSTANQVDDEGVIVFANDNIPDYTGVAVKAILEDGLKLPTVVENDANAAALGEYRFGAAVGQGNFILMTYGTGVGGGIVIDGKLLKGSHFGAGEFGHMITHIDGDLCKCGQWGCYEGYASTRALVREARKVDTRCQDGRMIMEKVAQKDPAISRVYKNWIHEVGQGLISIMMCFQPRLILMGGGIMENHQVVRDIEKDVRRNLMSSFDSVEFRPASLGNQAGLYGALYLAQELVLEEGEENDD